MDSIGVICEPDHPVFGPAAERLAARGFEVCFLRPTEPIERGDVDGLAALVGATVTPRSLAALRYADRSGVETWNGFVPATAFSSRLVALTALERVGCPVPELTVGGSGAGVPRRRFRWDAPATLDDTVELSQAPVGDDAVRDRYFAVDDGLETHVTVVEVRSRLSGDQYTLTEGDVAVELATRVRTLLDRFDARAVAVDFARGEDGTYAVDADPAPTFAGADMERRVADSMASLTTIGR